MDENSLKAFEEAALAVQRGNKEAEHHLLAFRESSQSLAACQYILEHSSVVQAQFQAAVAFRVSIIREWGLYAAADHTLFHQYIFHLLTTKEFASVVKNQLYQSYAVAIKRGYLERSEGERTEALRAVFALVDSVNNTKMALLGFSLFSALVSEFGLRERATGLNMSLDSHLHCRAAFQTEVLPHILRTCTDQLRIFSGSPELRADSDRAHLALLGLELFTAILGWDFRVHRSAAVFRSLTAAPDDELRAGCVVVTPPSSWRTLLLESDVLPTLVSILTHSPLSSPLRQYARHSLHRMAGFSGPIFDHAEARTAYFVHFLTVTLELLQHNQFTSEGDLEEALDLCKACENAVSACGPTCLAKTQFFLPLFEMLTSLVTRFILNPSHSSQDLEDMRPELLASVFNIFALTANSMTLEQLAPLAPCTMAVVEAYVSYRLTRAAAELAQGEDFSDCFVDDDVILDELPVIACIAMISPLDVLSGMLAMAARYTAPLHQALAAGSGSAEKALLMENLNWLFHILGHVCVDGADSNDDSLALPLGIIQMPLSADHPVVSLTTSVLTLLQSHQTAIHQHQHPESGLSPVLLQRIAWLLQRIVSAYCFPPQASRDRLPTTLLQFFSSTTTTGPWLQSVFTHICQFLVTYPAEDGLVSRLFDFLDLLTTRSALRPFFVHSTALTHLIAEIFSTDFSKESQFVPAFHRQCAAALTHLFGALAAEKSTDQNSLNEAFSLLTTPISSKFQIILTALQGSSKDDPAVVSHVLLTLDQVRGLAEGCEGATYTYIHRALFPLLPALEQLMAAYRLDPELTIAVMKVYKCMAVSTVSHMPLPHQHAFYDSLLKILELFRSSALVSGVQDGFSANGLTDLLRGISTVLKTITAVVAKNFLDFSDENVWEAEVVVHDAEAGDEDVSQLAFLSLDILLPLFSREVVDHMKISQHFFALLSFLMEVYPDRVASLPTHMLAPLLDALLTGLHSSDSAFTEQALDAVAGLASFCEKNPRNPSSDALAPLLRPFTQTILQLSLTYTFPTALLDTVADAMLVLILADKAHFQQLLEEICHKTKPLPLPITPSPTPSTPTDTQALLSHHCQQFLTDPKVSWRNDYDSKTVFRKAFFEFVGQAAPLVMVK